MIDKDFLESELKRLSQQFENVQRQQFDAARAMEQLSGAIQMTQGLLKKIEGEGAAEAAPVVSSED